MQVKFRACWLIPTKFWGEWLVLWGEGHQSNPNGNQSYKYVTSSSCTCLTRSTKYVCAAALTDVDGQKWCSPNNHWLSKQLFGLSHHWTPNRWIASWPLMLDYQPPIIMKDWFQRVFLHPAVPSAKAQTTTAGTIHHPPLAIASPRGWCRSSTIRSKASCATAEAKRHSRCQQRKSWIWPDECSMIRGWRRLI